MIKSFFNRITTRTRIGFFAAFFLLLVSYILTYISSKKVSSQDYWMNHTHEVIHNLDNLVGFITKAESEFRGYLITNDTRHLAVYDKSIKSTDSILMVIKTQANDNPRQIKNIDTLQSLIKQKFNWIKQNVAAYLTTHNVPATLLEESAEGTSTTKSIKLEIEKIKQEEIFQWNERSKKVTEYSGVIQTLNVLSIVIAVFLTIYSIVVYNRENKEKLRASKKAEEYKNQLQERVRQLANLNTELIELRRLEKYLVTGRVARVIAHEVRNPLTNINLACEQLQSELDPDEGTKMLFNMISRNSERINQLVSDLLNSTRVAELAFSEASINDILDSTIELARDRIKLNQIKVVKDYAQDPLLVSVDVEKIKIAFLNLIVNAVEAIGENGTIHISTEKVNNNCIVKISDDGKGMDKSALDRLFEPYYTTKEKGNGLGLANSQNIILGHKGNISAESEYGAGTTFTITLRQ